jgi:hypothetical protein
MDIALEFKGNAGMTGTFQIGVVCCRSCSFADPLANSVVVSRPERATTQYSTTAVEEFALLDVLSDSCGEVCAARCADGCAVRGSDAEGKGQHRRVCCAVE